MVLSVGLMGLKRKVLTLSILASELSSISRV